MMALGSPRASPMSATPPRSSMSSESRPRRAGSPRLPSGTASTWLMSGPRPCRPSFVPPLPAPERTDPPMAIDMALLRSLASEKEVSVDIVVETIERALLLAYQRGEGAHHHARAELEQSTGKVIIWAQQIDDDGLVLREWDDTPEGLDRKSTRLNSSHVAISYAVFCLKKKKRATHTA